jgi:hypothetical protein
MYTYLLQNRVIKPEPKDAKIEFPNNVNVEVVMEPLVAFGASQGPGRLVTKGNTCNFVFNANTGRIQVVQKKPLLPVTASLKTDNFNINLVGNTLSISFFCEDYQALYNILRTYLHVFPTLLNLSLAEPPTVKEITGKIGVTNFRWEYAEATGTFPEFSQNEINDDLLQNYQRIDLLNPNIVASLHYFHVASRLISAGNTPWEFMAESILNFCKSLQVLFGETMDSVRMGLTNLQIGYTEEEIEGDFIPIMILRNYFNVGHIQLQSPDIDQCNVLYEYLSITELNFRDFFRRLLEKESKNSATEPLILTQNYSKEKQKKFDHIIANIEKRLPRNRQKPELENFYNKNHLIVKFSRKE